MNQHDEAARITHEKVSAMMAAELNSLTTAERASILEDVHGVGDTPPEESNPNLMQQKLMEMDATLRSIPNKPAFDEAQHLCGGKSTGLVNDPAFRIRFLRAARYDPRKAAIRMIRNLQVIRETFGSECLVRPIQLNDMILDRGNQGSDTFMFSGNFFQIMPFRDRLGRRIVVRSGETITARGELDYITRIKAFLFVSQELSRDIECQLKGVVILGFPLDSTEDQPIVNQTMMRMMNTVSKNITPVRIAAVHICVRRDPWFRLASSLLLQVLPKAFRLRTRIHIGSIDECCYQLMAYGIPSDQIPIKSSGMIKNADHKRFIAYCQEREDAIYRNKVQYRGIFCPSSYDVLVGRGPRTKNHIGNEAYKILLQSKYERYNSSNIPQKRQIALEVIKEVHDYGGRFLIPAKNCWIEADAATARLKLLGAALGGKEDGLCLPLIATITDGKIALAVSAKSTTDMMDQKIQLPASQLLRIMILFPGFANYLGGSF